jgi:uncharacterized protein with PIN domain
MDVHRIERIKAEMQDEAARAIDDLAEELAKKPYPTLVEMEEAVLTLRQRLAQRMMEAIVAEQEQVRPVPGPKCEMCGEEMEYKGKKEVRVESRLGPLEVERGYYYCQRCKAGLFPPG